MLQSRVLPFRVLANDSKVDIGMASREARKRFAQDDGGIDVKLLAHGDIPGYVPGLGYRREKDALTGSEGRDDGRGRDDYL